MLCRLNGNNVQQLKSYAETFPAEFNLGAMQKLVLPVDSGGNPYLDKDAQLFCLFVSAQVPF